MKRPSQVEISDNESCDTTSWMSGLKKEEQIYICMATTNNPMDSNIEIDLRDKD